MPMHVHKANPNKYCQTDALILGTTDVRCLRSDIACLDSCDQQDNGDGGAVRWSAGLFNLSHGRTGGRTQLCSFLYMYRHR